MKDLCLNELYEKYGQYEDWYRGGICKGRNCHNLTFHINWDNDRFSFSFLLDERSNIV